MLLVVIAVPLLTSCKTKAPESLSPQARGNRLFVPEHSPNVFLIMYDSIVGKEPLMKAIKEYNCEIVYDYHSFNGMALKKPEEKSLEETMQYFRTVKGVLTVEYDHIIRLTDPVKPRLEVM